MPVTLEDLQKRVERLDERCSALEHAHRTATNDLLRLRERLSHAEAEAGEAKKMSETGSHVLRATEKALIAHVDKATRGLADNDVRQNRLLEDLLAKSAGMLEAFQEKRVRDQARSMLNAELEQQTAITIEKAERRRKVITWAMGTLFVAAQIIQIAANVKRAE